MVIYFGFLGSAASAAGSAGGVCGSPFFFLPADGVPDLLCDGDCGVVGLGDVPGSATLSPDGLLDDLPACSSTGS